MLNKIYKIIALVIASIIGLFMARKVASQIINNNMDITVTKKAVNKTDSGYQITLNLVCIDGTEEVINQDFIQNHNPNNSVSVAIGVMKEKMQKVIDDYTTNQTVLNSQQLDNAVADIQNSLK